jgi:glyoxylase-like metal-dependent hydrolase (beta-lactamase superfamily II)
MDTIHTLDTNWNGRPRAVATALLISRGHYTLVDPGPASTLENLRRELERHGVTIANLDAILLTHIHLDHAGATGALVRENPRLTVYVHSRGAPHLQDPSKLLGSATRLWGSDLPRLYGETLPVRGENLRILEGGETLRLGARKVDVAYTPGHAFHHVSYFDKHEGTAFVGDTGGVRIENGPYILPATPPPDINLELWDASFTTILERQPTRLFLTHFGHAENPAAHIAEFRERLHRWAHIAADNLKNSPDEIAASASFVKTVYAELINAVPEGMADPYAFTAGMDLSFLGLMRYLRKRDDATTSNATTPSSPTISPVC